jgi:hypothetical protein
VAAYSGSGAGTSGDPYIITTYDQLREFGQDIACDNYLTSYWKLGDNIDATSSSSLGGGAGWTPVGTFTGGFDGDDYTIDKISINRLTTNYVGFFGYNNSNNIINLNLDNVVIVGKNGVGGFCGTNEGIITSCTCDGSVTGGLKVGDFCGQNIGTITACYSTGDSTGTNATGGFCGDNVSVITNCYSTGSSTGGSLSGGFCGYNNGTITNCYSIGSATGSSSVGGFCGYNDGTITSCYWDTTTSGNATSDGGTGKTTAQMKTIATFVNWVWTAIWDINPTVTYPTFEPYGGHTLDTVDPTTGTVAGGTAITLTLSAYATGATGVTFGGQSATSVVVVNDTSITCVTPAHVSGAVDVVVTCRDTGTITKASGYAYTLPTLDTVDPVSGSVAGGTAITLTLSAYATGATGVTFGGDAATDLVVASDTSITCTTPAHAAGAVDIVVTLVNTETITKASGYEYLADASFSIEPPFGYILGGTPVVLKGSGFTGATGVTFGGDAATSVVVDSDTQISAITPAHAAGAVDIIVVIP